MDTGNPPFPKYLIYDIIYILSSGQVDPKWNRACPTNKNAALFTKEQRLMCRLALCFQWVRVVIHCTMMMGTRPNTKHNHSIRFIFDILFFI